MSNTTIDEIGGIKARLEAIDGADPAEAQRILDMLMRLHDGDMVMIETLVGKLEAMRSDEIAAWSAAAENDIEVLEAVLADLKGE